MTPRTVGITERLPLLQALPLSLQHLFAMFGATVLVPFLVGLDTSVTLFTSGVGTLLYIVITKGRIPAYLGSSFAFIAALSGILAREARADRAADERVAIAMGGCVTVGLIYIVVAARHRASSAPAGSTSSCRRWSSARWSWSSASGSPASR